MRLAGKIIGTTIFLIVLLLVSTPFFISKDDIIDKVSKQVEQTTGRKLTVNGESSLSVFPALYIELNDVTFSNFIESTEPNMASMRQVALHFPWLSIFTGELSVEKFVIEDLNLLLETTKKGKTNWDLFAQSEPQVQTKAQTSNSTTAIPSAFDISLGEVEIVGGNITYSNDQNNSSERLENLNLQVIFPSLRQPMEIRGSLLYKTESFTLTSVLDNPIKLIEGKSFDTSVAITSTLLNLNYSGKIEQTPLSLLGELSLAGKSLKALSKWYGQDLKAKELAFNQFSLASQISLLGETVSLTDLNLQLDKLNIEGNSTLALSTPVKLTAEINLGDVDLNPYIPTSSETLEEPVAEKNKTPIVWDDTSLDLSALAIANLDIKVTANSMQVKDIKLGANQFSLHLQDRFLTLSMDKFQAYKGEGIGKIELNGAVSPYELHTNFNLTEVKVKPLLTDALGFEKLMGTGKLEWQLSAIGNSQKQFITTLNGTLGFNLIDGAVQGANIAAIAKSASNIIQGNLAAVNLDTEFSSAQKTDFASLTGSFVFEDGIGKNEDLSLLNPLVRVAGNGTLDLPNTKLDFRTRSKLVSSLEGQGGKIDESGITVPIRIEGPFHDIEIKPDVSSEVKDKLKEKVKNKLFDLIGN